MINVSFFTPDLTMLCCLDGLGLNVIGQHITVQHAVLVCCPVGVDDWCHRCGCRGLVGDATTCGLVRVLFGRRPTTPCAKVWLKVKASTLSTAACQASRPTRPQTANRAQR